MNRRDFLKRLGLMPFILALKLPKVELPEEPLEHDHPNGLESVHDYSGPRFDIETMYCFSGPTIYVITDGELEAYYEVIQNA